MAITKSSEIISRKDIVKVLVVLISNWYIILGLPVLAYIGSYIYTHRIPEVYAAKCQILLKSNETYNYQQQIYKGLGFSSKYASYEETASQMRVITSSNLIEEVLDRIPLDVSYYIVGRLKTTEVYKHMPFEVQADERANLQSGMEFNLNILDMNKFRVQYEVQGVRKDKVFEFGQLVADDGLYLRIVRKPNLNKSSIENLSKMNYMFRVFKKGALLSRYKNAINVKNIDYTSIIEITLKDEIQLRAREVLDTLANLYVQNTVSNQLEVNENTLNYIDRQLNEVILIINEIEAEIESYKERKSILNLGREEDTYFNQLIDLDEERRNYELELQALEDLTNYLFENREVESLLPPSMYVANTDPLLRERVQQLYNLRASYSSYLNGGTVKNPKIDAILRSMDDLRKEILIYIEVQKKAVKKALLELESKSDLLEVKIKDIPKTQRQLLNIERRLVVNEELYSFLLSKRAETVIAKAGLIPDTKVIERARGAGVVYPDKQQINLLSLLVALFAAVAIVVIKEFFFQKITSLGQLQSTTDISILGSIPKKKNFSKTYRIVDASEKSDIVQAFRSLRTNLQYFSPKDSGTIALVTSLMPGEGKTFTSVNLASVLAIANKKVLIIDFDLHKPRLAKAMELENDVGVSSFLIGAKNLEDIIQKTEIDTLDVITSGPVPPNASELIMRDELNEIFRFGQEHYDYVFLDTPPISPITDGVLLMNKADVKLFVLNSKSTTKTSIDYIEQLIEKNDLKNCTLVLNEERLSRINYYYSRYGYGGYGYGGYGYGYGYGYGGHYGDTPSKG